MWICFLPNTEDVGYPAINFMTSILNQLHEIAVNNKKELADVILSYWGLMKYSNTDGVQYKTMQ